MWVKLAEQICKVIQNLRGLVEFVLIAATVKSRNPGQYSNTPWSTLQLSLPLLIIALDSLLSVGCIVLFAVFCTSLHFSS